MIKLAEKIIEGKTVILEVDETLSDKTIGGQPVLKIDNDITIIYAVDTLKVVKAIYNSDTLFEVVKYVKGSWAESKIKQLLVEMEV